MKTSLKNYKIYVIIYTCLIIISCSIVTYTKISFDKSEIEFNNKKNSYENKLISESINDILQTFIKYLYEADYYMTTHDVEFSYKTWKDFINSTTLFHSPYVKYLQEVRLNYNISDSQRENYENSMKLVTNNNDFSIFDSPNIRSSYRQYYCPITYLAPNNTEIIYKYIGYDICNSSVFASIIELLDKYNNDNELIVVNTRYLGRIESDLVDVLKRNNNGIVSMAFSFKDIFNQIFIQIKKTDNLLYSIYSGGGFNINNTIGINLDTYKKYSNIMTIRLNTRDVILNIDFYDNNFTSTKATFYFILVIILIFDIFITIFLYFIINHQTILEKLRKNRVTNLMLSYINHEIRNPLNIIKGLLDIIIYESNNGIYDEESRISNLYTMKNTCLLLEHIVNDILDINKLLQNKLVILYESHNLPRILKDIEKALNSKISENPSINFIIENNINEIITDEYRLKQIILNLLTNSFKFTDSGYIKLSVSEDISKYIFIVDDSGHGIPDSKKNIIFKPFEQTDIKDSLRHGGLGLGLYLCKLILDNMHGNISFKSTVNIGTVFTFTLPKTTQSK